MQMANGLFTAEWNSVRALGEKRSFCAGEFLYLQGESDIGLICLVKGRIRNSFSFASGAEKTMSIVEGPAIIGETAVIDGGASICSPRAMTDVEAVMIQRDVARTFIESHPNFMLLLLQNYTKIIRGLELQTESLILNTTQKLARLLVNFRAYGFYYPHPDDENIQVTHEILASFLGVSRTKITEALVLFEEKKLIRKSRGRIEILARDGLKALYE
ncbi:MAG: Crp/Fnr family transcriptional regulator [Gracilibacteraceae bacterium]|jgi:CRP-like cAMP-binding protein|nr:Crp/Fnr family transcriptional regulator [Gracilibacteraceae bacterium]